VCVPCAAAVLPRTVGSPFDDNTTGKPRLRRLPPTPQWLRRLLGPDAEAGCGQAEQDAGGAYSSLAAAVPADC
jgi:hypothetical protein